MTERFTTSFFTQLTMFNRCKLATPVFLALTLNLVGCGTQPKSANHSKGKENKKSQHQAGIDFVDEKLGTDGTYEFLIRYDTGTSDGTGISIFDGEHHVLETVTRWRVITNDQQSFVYGWRFNNDITNQVTDQYLKKSIEEVLRNSPRKLAENYIKKRLPNAQNILTIATTREILHDATLVWVVTGSFESEGKSTPWKIMTSPTYSFVFGSKIGNEIEIKLENVDEDSDIGQLLTKSTKKASVPAQPAPEKEN